MSSKEEVSGSRSSDFRTSSLAVFMISSSSTTPLWRATPSLRSGLVHVVSSALRFALGTRFADPRRFASQSEAAGVPASLATYATPRWGLGDGERHVPQLRQHSRLGYDCQCANQHGRSNLRNFCSKSRVTWTTGCGRSRKHSTHAEVSTHVSSALGMPPEFPPSQSAA